MDQCTFGAGPLRGARGETVSKRPAKESERARICPFSFAPLTLNVDPDFGAACADTNFADYHRELRANVHRSIEFIRRARPGLRLQQRPETCRILKPTRSWLSRLNLVRRRRAD
jgi:hypothetical protein